MSSDDNVVKMPTELTRLFEDAHRAVTMGVESKQKFVESKLLLSASLAAIRAKFQDNSAFGKSCSEHGLGDNVVSPNERAILIQWAERPEWTRTVLEKTERISVQTIHAKEWCDSLTSPSKTPENQYATTAKREEAETAIRVYKTIHGVYPTVIQACQITGLSRIVIEPALATVKAEDRVAPTELRFTKAQEHHVEVRVKIEVKSVIEQLNKSFELEVEKRNKVDIDKLFPDLEKIREDALKTEKLYRGLIEKQAILTEAEYRDILLCTHEANPSPETRKRAFIALNAKKLQLTGKIA